MSTPPWKKPRPKSSAKVKLTAENIVWARANAKKHRRRYPNLVDNMAALRRQLGQDSPGKSSLHDHL